MNITIERRDAPLRRLRMEDVLDVERLCVTLDRCVAVVPGPVDQNVLSVLTERGYDQAPVYDPVSRYYWGLVETTYLRTLFETDQPLSSDDPHVRDERWEFRVGPLVTLFGLLDKMAEQRSVLVIRESDATEYGHHESIWGLFTISDLNRQAVRSAIYRLLADVESGLAKWLEEIFPDPWAWLQHLDEEQQARVLGYWELSKKQGVDVGPVAALTLAQLVNVIARHDTASERLGYPSRSQFAKSTGRLPRLRNRVMHPVRPLILTHQDVGDAYRAVLVLEDLRERVDGLLARKSEP
jgi:hypothetical protein